MQVRRKKITKNIYTLTYNDSVKVIADCLASEQVKHTVILLKTINNYVDKDIMQQLGLYDGTFKQGKHIKRDNTLYSVFVREGKLFVEISKARDTPPKNLK